MKIDLERQLVKKSYNLNELNGEDIQVWIDTLLDIQSSVSGDGYIVAEAYYEDVDIDFHYTVLESDKDYKLRINNETYQYNEFLKMEAEKKEQERLKLEQDIVRAKLELAELHSKYKNLEN